MEGDKPVVKGPVDGNIFAVLGAADTALRKAGLDDQAAEMYERVTSDAHSYHEALAIIMEYVKFDL